MKLLQMYLSVLISITGSKHSQKEVELKMVAFR